MQGLNNFNHAVGQNAYHLVWKPKYAWPIFQYTSITRDCEAILRSITERWKFKIYGLKVMPDHIRLFVECPPTIPVSKALQIFKGGSAYQLFRKYHNLRRYKNFRKGHFWTPGKFFRFVGNVTSETIQHYIS